MKGINIPERLAAAHQKRAEADAEIAAIVQELQDLVKDVTQRLIARNDAALTAMSEPTTRK